MFGLRQKRDAVSRTVTYGHQDAPTAQENRAVNWQVATGMCLIGVPSLVAVGATAIVNADFCAYLSGGAGSLSQIEYAGLAVAFTGLLAGLPIAVERLKGDDVAKYGLWLWYTIVGFSAIASVVTVAATPVSRPPAPPVVNAVRVMQLSKSEGDIDQRIREAEDALHAIPAHRGIQTMFRAWNDARSFDWKTWEETNECRDIRFNYESAICNRLGRFSDEYWNAVKARDIKRQLVTLRNERDAGESRVETVSAATTRTPFETSLADASQKRLLWAFISLVRLAVASIGMLLTTKYIASQLTGRTQFPGQMQALLEAEPISAMPGIDADKSFQLWNRNVSFPAGSKAQVRAGEVYAHYETWCGANELSGLNVLGKNEFGAKMTEFVARNGGKKKHSNGSVYEGIALAEIGSREF